MWGPVQVKYKPEKFERKEVEEAVEFVMRAHPGLTNNLPDIFIGLSRDGEERLATLFKANRIVRGWTRDGKYAVEVVMKDVASWLVANKKKLTQYP
jgi:hypothetical protein